MKTIWIVPIEPIDSRYTKQWYDNIPKIIGNRIAELSLGPSEVRTIDGNQGSKSTTAGAFLDFAVTNGYKASQVERIATLFQLGQIKPGDKFLITDAWNFAVTAIRYMSELLDIPVEIHGIWHAGAYDPTDILGMKMSKPWPWLQEKAWYHAIDYNYYATDFHKRMFLHNLEITDDSKAFRSGQPHEPLIDQLRTHDSKPKLRTVIWPHRYNADKQPEIAEDLKTFLPVEITSNQGLSKTAYYDLLGLSQVIFSCALHENLGISIMESVLAGGIPVLPDRCSYSEMYLPEFLYPSEWTSSWDNYLKNKPLLIDFINERLDHPERFAAALEQQKAILKDRYLTCTVMIDKLLDVK